MMFQCASHLLRRSLGPSTTALRSSKPTTSLLDHSSSLDLQVRHRSNRSRRGLYDGKDVRSGNNLSFSMKSTKRQFKPNVHLKRVYSEVLDEMVRFHLTTSTLRSIDKAGGLDNYLMKNNFTEGEGYVVKKRIMERLKQQASEEDKVSSEQV